ncbi:MAG: transketolase [Endomicrobium sp.]|jgi:transketolase|nr:transketolase [Endomicrobium sp.]
MKDKNILLNLNEIAIKVRKDILTMISNAGSGHPGSSLSAVELLVSLYFKHLKVNIENPHNQDRDYFILSKGHACPLLYSILARKGFFDVRELYTLRKLGSRLQGHPSKDKNLPGIEISTGSLGYGLSIGVGIAAGLKCKTMNTLKVYVMMGDGEHQEGSVWEAAMAASHYNLSNLCAIIDNNKLQIDGKTRHIMNVESLMDKYRSFGWMVLEVDGHNFKEIDKAYLTFKEESKKPVCIIANTVKGKGISFMEHQVTWHGKTISNADLIKALKELENK